MKRFIIEVLDSVTADDIHQALYNGDVDYVHNDGWLREVPETWGTADGKPRMTTKQRDALWSKCGDYNVPFKESDYYRPTGTKYYEGWIGGNDYCVGNDNGLRPTIYVGVGPEGDINS